MLFSGDQLGEHPPHTGRGEPVAGKQGSHITIMLRPGDKARQGCERGEKPPVPQGDRLRQGPAEASGALHTADRVRDRHVQLRPRRPGKAPELWQLRLEQVRQRTTRQREDVPWLLRVHLPEVLR